jgi:hypothetical protein
MSARKRPRIASTSPRLLGAAACALVVACSSSQAPQGSPILTHVYWIAGSERLLAWSFDQDPGLVTPVPPLASQVDFVFDRRLDGDKIEVVTYVKGVMVTTPKDPPSVRVTWPGMTSATDFQMTLSYDSTPKYGDVSSYVFARPAEPGFPSSTLVTFSLDASLLTSQTGERAVVPPSIPIKTSGFSVTIGASTGPVLPGYQLPLNFSNRLPKTPATSPQIHVRTHGADVPYKLLGDGSLSSRWYVAAADCLGGWPANATFDVTIDADFVDAFGGKLGQPAMATFSTSPGSAADASCSVPDAGAGDAADASLEGGGADDAAPADAGAPDGGAEAGDATGADAGAADVQGAAGDAPADAGTD